MTDELLFPPAQTSREDGLIAVGGDASPGRLILAYSQGIFPWPMDGLPLLWFSPDPRFVLDFPRIHIPKSLRKEIHRDRYTIRADTAFGEVIHACAQIPRPGQPGTWITDELEEAYLALHRQGYAHSIEAWQDDRLVGGLYGVSLGHAFFGESMFSHEPNASKVAFVTLLGNLMDWNYDLIDCQVATDHLARFGAHEISRTEFLKRLTHSVEAPSRVGPWKFELDPDVALRRIDGRTV